MRRLHATAVPAPRQKVDPDLKGGIVAYSLWSILSGRSLPYAELARRLGLTENQLLPHLKTLTEAGLLEGDLDRRSIHGVHGATLTETPIRLNVWGREIFARSLGAAVRLIAELLEGARATLRCPECGRNLTVTWTEGRVARISPRRHELRQIDDEWIIAHARKKRRASLQQRG